MNKITKNIKLIARVIIVLFPILICLWLFNKYYAPLGKLEIKYSMEKDSSFISELYPKERTGLLKKEDNQNFRELLDDITYFDLKLPRNSFNKATIKIKFKNNNLPIFDLAGLTSEENWSFDTYTLENKFIDQSNWSKIQEDDLILLQKNKKYDNINNFLQSIKASTKIAYYNYNHLPRIIEIENYKKSNNPLEINHALRDKHSFYTYIDNENLDFTFTYQDLNRNEEADPFKINIIKEKNGEIVKQELVEDNTIGSSGILSEEMQFKINIPNLEKGAYKINLDLGSDILIKKIITKQSLIVFDKSLYIAQNNEYLPEINPSDKIPLDFYNVGTSLYVSTDQKNSLQNIKINDQENNIDTVNKRYNFNQDTLTESFNKIHSEKSNLYLETDGYFVFAKNQYFDPQPKNIAQLNKDLNLDSYNYLIAKYNPHQVISDDWLEASAKFDLTKLYINKDNKLTFRLSSPGLKDTENKIKISEINVLFEKEPLNFQKILEKIK